MWVLYWLHVGGARAELTIFVLMWEVAGRKLQRWACAILLDGLYHPGLSWWFPPSDTGDTSWCLSPVAGLSVLLTVFLFCLIRFFFLLCKMESLILHQLMDAANCWYKDSDVTTDGAPLQVCCRFTWCKSEHTYTFTLKNAYHIHSVLQLTPVGIECRYYMSFSRWTPSPSLVSLL